MYCLMVKHILFRLEIHRHSEMQSNNSGRMSGCVSNMRMLDTITPSHSEETTSFGARYCTQLIASQTCM